ncbi:MAG TPA: hypothetical protein VF475_12605 [Sphingobium sp.]
MVESRIIPFPRPVAADRMAQPALAGHRPVTTGHGDLDAGLHGGLARGRLHELFAASGHASQAAGCAAMLAIRANGGAAPFLWLRNERAEREGGRLYMPGLAALGGTPEKLLLATFRDDQSLLRAALEAARCRGLGALVVESWGQAPLYTLTMSRRLALAAEKSGVTLFLIRIDAEPVPSAAATRWSVRAAPSLPMAANAPGHGVMEIELLRRRNGPAGMRWRMEWNHEERRFREPALAGPVAAPVEYRAGDARRRSA